MERKEWRRADSLDRYWDAVLRGDSPHRPEDVDEVSAAIVAGLAERRVLPDLDAVNRRIRRRITTPRTIATDAVAAPVVPMSRATTSDLQALRRPGVPATSSSRWWRSIQVTLVVLLLLATGVGIRLFWSSQEMHRITAPDLTTTVTAVPSPATPVPTATLLQTTIPASRLGPGRVWAALDHVILQPGARSTWNAYQKVQLRYVVRGVLTVRSAGPMRLWHAGQDKWEAIPAPAQVELDAGDAALFLSTATVSFENAGTEPVELIGWLLSGQHSDPVTYPPEWETDVVASSSADGISLAVGSGVLRLQQVVLPPAYILSPPPLAVSQIGMALSSDAGSSEASTIENRDDGRISNPGTEPVTAYVVTLEAIRSSGNQGDGQSSRNDWRDPRFLTALPGGGS